MAVAGSGSPVRGMAALHRGFSGAAVLFYLTAVIIALPLGLAGVVRVEFAVVPLGLGNVFLAVGMLGEARAER
jgi:hypothetical protein